MDTELKKEEIRPENKPYFFEKMEKETTKDTTKEYFIYVLIIVAIIAIRTFVATPIRVNGESMYPTLKDGEVMILNKINYRFNDIERFDIVVVNTSEEKIIKRVIGLPGETLKYENGTLYINGKEVKESYLKEVTDDFDLIDQGYEKIPDDCYYVLGDNRNNSKDSRMIGPVTKKQIVGRASLVIYPFKDMGYRN